MFRLMQPSDLAAMKALWELKRGEPAEFAEKAICRFAGTENAYIAEENGQLQALVLAVPISIRGRAGSYLYGLCSEDSGTAAGLVDFVCAQQKQRGADFSVVVPSGAAQTEFFRSRGFAQAFALRCLNRPVRRNIWSQAEFDTITAKNLCELRQKYAPNAVQMAPEQMAIVLGDLYSRGATLISDSHGYGVYFRQDDTLYFVELLAEDDHAAETLMEAAREKEIIVEKAVVTIGAAQNLFLGEGTRMDYGMIRFERAPFDVSETYMRLMLEN